MLIRKLALTFMSLGCVSITGSAFAVTVFTETFNSGAANWLTGASTAPTYSATGGVDDSGFISYSPATFNSGSGGFGDPLQIMFRGNASADASGDAFVGDWLGGGIVYMTIDVQHNYTDPLNFYARIAGVGGAGASIANIYTIAPNTWTTITIPITDTNPPFISYGSSTFNGVFTNVQNLQFGLYLPANTEFTGLTMGIDNVSVVPEPGTAALAGMGLGLLALRRRRAPLA